MAVKSIVEIKEAAKMLDTAAVQWMNADPPQHIQSSLSEARELLQRGMELADAPLRIALVGEFNSGKTLLLNSLLDSTDVFPCLLQPTTGNVLEVRVHLRPDKRPPEIRKATVSFFTQYEVENILEQYLKELKNQGIDGLPAKIGSGDLERMEQLLCKKFQDLRAITPKYAILSALEFIVALRQNRELVWREERHSCSLPIDLISTSLTLTGRPDLNKGIQAIHNSYKQMYGKKGTQTRGLIEKITSKNLTSIFPMIRRVMVDVTAWDVPFGMDKKKSSNTLAFLDFPGLGAESSSARDYYLCMSEIRDAHAVLVVFNGSNPGTSGASVMATLFQKAGKLTGERTIICVNRFDEFHPLPGECTVQDYYSHIQDGTTVGFSTILIPAKNLLSGMGKKFSLYVCSALCYLFDEKSRRASWNFGKANWFNDSKRQAAYSLFQRCKPDFEKIINQVESSRGAPREQKIMTEGLGRYIHSGGIPSLREDLVNYAVAHGERLIREDSLKEIRNAVRILDEIAPKAIMSGSTSINPEVSYAAQEFYRVLELSVADTLPGGPSDYQKLKLRIGSEDKPLWDLIEGEIATQVSSWPEWFAILNQGATKSPSRPGKPRKQFGRYAKLKKIGAEVPTEFSSFNERFRSTGELLTQQTLEYISQAIVYSVQRFENHPDYRDAIEHFQTMIYTDKLANIEEALPLLDVWQPSQMTEEEVIPTILERINDEVEAIEKLSYPYDGSKPCFWNLALIIRIQVQLMKTYRDKLSRLVAASESEFSTFFGNDILRAEILPLVRTVLNDPEFLGDVAAAEVGSSWESVGQVVRAAVNRFKDGESGTGAANFSAAPIDQETQPEESPEDGDFEEEEISEEPPVEQEPEEPEEPKLEEEPLVEEETLDQEKLKKEQLANVTEEEPKENEEDAEEFEEW